jgi:hypothetical protein
VKAELADAAGAVEATLRTLEASVQRTQAAESAAQAKLVSSLSAEVHSARADLDALIANFKAASADKLSALKRAQAKVAAAAAGGAQGGPDPAAARAVKEAQKAAEGIVAKAERRIAAVGDADAQKDALKATLMSLMSSLG